MIHIPVSIKLPFLWGKTVFRKNSWCEVNLIVGPNGAGKTLLAEQLAAQFEASGRRVYYLRSERGAKDDVYEFLKANPQVREKIEEILSGMFGKFIRFEELENGQLYPIVVNKSRNVEYGLKDGECHGLQEIILLLTTLYSADCDCLILDEPELHLHPQLQMSFMNEIRRMSRLYPTRMYMIITHSPFFIDLRSPEDFTGVIVCHINRAPTHIDMLCEHDEHLLRRFLPRFNTYHKQFFFSDNQIFVEGYTDQQIFSMLLDYLPQNPNKFGTGIIDVGGKDELGVFFIVCSLLGTQSRIITDLDSLFRGKLREVLCHDERPAEWLSKQAERQQSFYERLFRGRVPEPVSLELLIARLEQMLAAVGNAVCGLYTEDAAVEQYAQRIRFFIDANDAAEDLDTYKSVVLQGIERLGDTLAALLPRELAADIVLIRSLFALILAAAESAFVFFLPRGCIEHYYRRTDVQYMPIAAKDRLFHAELQYIKELDGAGAVRLYGELLEVLDKASSRAG